MTDTHWHVLGAGAIGCLFATALHRGGCPTTLLLRRGTGKNTTAVVVDRGDASDELQLPVSALDDNEPITHLLVTTKAYDVRDAVTAVAHRLQIDSQVLLLANGMGFVDELRRDFPHLDLYCGTTTEGAYRIAPRHICHAGRGQTRVGQPGTTQPAPWFAQWVGAIESCLWDANIEQALWLKLAINCAINPLTAVHGCHNGELSRQPELAAELSRLCDEIALISQAAGFSDVAGKVHRAVAEVIAGTAHNRSSMLQDVQGGRRTEIDYITGHLLGVARQYGVEAPHHTAMLERVRRIDH